MTPKTFFDELDANTLRTDRRTRLEAELRAHIEDARANAVPEPERQLGKPEDVAGVFNAVTLRREWPMWMIAGILLGAFALLVQLVTTWLVSGFLSNTIGVVTHLPLTIAPNPSERLMLLVYAVTFLWIYPVFWVCVRKAFRTLHKTSWTWVLVVILYTVPLIIHAGAATNDPEAYWYYFFPPHQLVPSVLLVVLLIHTAQFLPFWNRSWQRPRILRIGLSVALTTYILYTTYLFYFREPDGTLSLAFGASRMEFLAAFIRAFFETVAADMVSLVLSFLPQPLLWSVIGSLLSLWWVYTVLQFAATIRARRQGIKRPFPFVHLVAFVYLTSILSTGATDKPDIVFPLPSSSISLAIEQRTVLPWPNLSRYFHRFQNTYPFYHTAWDERQGAFLIEQSARRLGSKQSLTPVGQWFITPSNDVHSPDIRTTNNLHVQYGGFGVENDGTSLTPLESEMEDITLEKLEAKGLHCETDEPFPSCFVLRYRDKLTEIFSHTTRSIVVTNAVVSPNEHWLLLTLTMRYSGNEYVYLIDLRKEP